MFTNNVSNAKDSKYEVLNISYFLYLGNVTKRNSIFYNVNEVFNDKGISLFWSFVGHIST